VARHFPAFRDGTDDRHSGQLEELDLCLLWARTRLKSGSEPSFQVENKRTLGLGVYRHSTSMICGNMVRFHGEPPPEKPRPREPERKKPEAGRLTEAQKTEMRRKLLRNLRIECPEDGAFFEVHDVTAQQSVGREFLIICPGLRPDGHLVRSDAIAASCLTLG
jgi:hypothetical protein